MALALKGNHAEKRNLEPSKRRIILENPSIRSRKKIAPASGEAEASKGIRRAEIDFSFKLEILLGKSK